MSAAGKLQESITAINWKGPDQEPGRTMRWHIIGGLCLLHGYRKGAELGVSQGRFTMYLTAIMHDLQMVCVDLWAEQAPREGIECAETYTGWNHEQNYQKFRSLSEQYFPGRISIHRMDSASAATLVPDGSLDFVFIDADHTYEGCLRDIDAWSPKVRDGGMIAGHDYSKKWPPVQKAVQERFKKFAVAKDSVWVHFKNGK